MTGEFTRDGRDQVSIHDVDRNGSLKVFVTTPGHVIDQQTGEIHKAKRTVIPGAIHPAGNGKWKPDQDLTGWLTGVIEGTNDETPDGWASPELASQHIEGLLVYRRSRLNRQDQE